MPESNWHRPARSRAQGGVGTVADLTVSRGDLIRLFIPHRHRLARKYRGRS